MSMVADQGVPQSSETSESTACVSRRRLIQTIAATGTILSVGTSNASAQTARSKSPVSAEEAEAILEAYADHLLKTLAARDILDSLSVEDLPLDEFPEEFEDEGVFRTVRRGTAVYAVHKQVDRGLLVIVVRPATEQALATLNTSDGSKVFGDQGRVSMNDDEVVADNNDVRKQAPVYSCRPTDSCGEYRESQYLFGVRSGCC